MAKWTPAGEMRKHITIEKISMSRTAGGETTDAPSTVCYAWAKIAPVRGGEQWTLGQQQATNVYKINMRYQAGITSRMRANYQGRIFNFNAVNDIDELHRELEILATEVITN